MTRNQPRPFDPVTGVERGGPEYGELHAAHRLLNDRLSGAAMPPAVEREVTARIRDLIATLDDHQALREHDRFDGLRPDLPGRGHPLLPPFVLDEEIWDDARTTVRGRVTFSRFHLGGGAAVHGGVPPLLFDDICGRAANRGRNSVARTAYLKVDYRNVTPLDVELHWDATLDRIEGRKRFVTGRLAAADGTLLAEAESLFVELRPGQP